MDSLERLNGARTGYRPIVAALDRDEACNDACARLLGTTREPLVVVAPTLVEIDYWIRKRMHPDVWRAFVEDMNAGAYLVAELGARERLRAVDLAHQ